MMDLVSFLVTLMTLLLYQFKPCETFQHKNNDIFVPSPEASYQEQQQFLKEKFTQEQNNTEASKGVAIKKSYQAYFYSYQL